MKTWKMAGCIALLAVVICGCIILGQGTSATSTPADVTDTPPDATSNPLNSEQAPPQDTTTTPTPEQSEEGDPSNTGTQASTSVSKPYSEGLAFRSNGDGTCAVSGIGTCNSACVLIPPKSPNGDTVTEILPYAFSGAIIGAIEIPATVTTIASSSFEGCPRLSLLRVESGSLSFADYNGILYSADYRTLVFCPRGKGASEITLHKNVRRVCADAFADCVTIKTINYAGSSAEWQSLVIGDGNAILFTATIKTGIA